MRHHLPQRQRGAVLIVALLFLVMLTLLGVTAMTSTTMEERMAGNARDSSVAFQAAEAALRDARRDLNCYPSADCSAGYVPRGLGANWPLDIVNFGVTFNVGSCNVGPGSKQGLCRPAAYVGGEKAQLPAVPNDTAHSFTNTSSNSPTVAYGTFTGVPALEGVAQQPRYLIELFCLVRHDAGLGGTDNCNFFRVTAVGYGANPLTTVTLQEIVVKEGA